MLADCKRRPKFLRNMQCIPAVALSVIVAAFVIALPALAQQSGYFNFDLRSNTGTTVVMRGSFYVSSLSTSGGSFTSLDESSTFYSPSGLSGSVYGVSNTTAISGSWGTYGPITSTTATDDYFVSGATFRFTTTESGVTKYYQLQGSVSENNANTASAFTLYSSDINYSTSSLKRIDSYKMTSVGGASATVTLSNTTSEVPEIDGGNLPKAILLFFCVIALAAGARAGLLATSLWKVVAPLASTHKAHRPHLSA